MRWPRIRRLSRRAAVITVVCVVAALAAIVGGVLSSRAAPVHSRSQFVAGTAEGTRPVQLDTTLYLPEHTPAPAVLLAHGFGGDKDDLADQARTLARNGYVVLAYSARGFGRSGGLIHLDAPDYEVHDGTLLVSYLASLPQVLSTNGDPRVAVAGSSYGGALALLLAGTDKRVDAVGADITWNDLATALFPNGAGTQPGVFKKLWAGFLFQSAGGGACGRFAADLCAAYERAAQTGTPDAAMLALLRASSPATVLDKITAPTLLSQGEQDSLFPLTEADANARGIAGHGTTVKVIWRQGGHDSGAGDPTGQLVSWLDGHLRGNDTGRPTFDMSERGAALSSQSGQRISQTLRVDGYPGIDGTPRVTRAVVLAAPPQPISAPAGGNPAAVSSIPRLGSVDQPFAAAGGLAGLSTIPGQVATFASAPLPDRLLLAGASTVPITVTSSTTDATLFVALRDVSGDGSQVLPSGLVTPVRLTGLTPNQPRSVTVSLPAVAYSVAGGHRLALTVSTTDLAYQLPADPRTYTVAVTGPVTAPTVTGTVVRVGHPAAWLISGLVIAAVVLAGGTVTALRRRAGRPDPSLADVPIAVTDLVKSYADGYRAVDGITFRVERGQVVGLLGPNGAGKTTTLRMLVGLIRPTAGKLYVFGSPIRPGAPVLARLGAFIEGPGFLPHLSGRENLRLFWAATGRATDTASLDTALEIAGLGASVDRRVKTYSHGMKQRLAIAQAMLGLPELLVLDEPTNGLDPPQIAEMREVLQRYAATGRTVVVSSHLLAEVEQTCTHVVVMHKGKLVAAGSTAEIAGAGGMQLVVADPARAAAVLAQAGIASEAVPARRALEDVFLDLIGDRGD